jgi:hypothetical protein
VKPVIVILDIVVDSFGCGKRTNRERASVFSHAHGTRKEDFLGNSADSKDVKADSLLRRRSKRISEDANVTRQRRVAVKTFYERDVYRSAPTGEAEAWGEVWVAD